MNEKSKLNEYICWKYNIYTYIFIIYYLLSCIIFRKNSFIKKKFPDFLHKNSAEINIYSIK